MVWRLLFLEGDLVDLDLEDSKDYVWPDLSHPLASSNEFHLKKDRTPYGFYHLRSYDTKKRKPSIHSIQYTELIYYLIYQNSKLKIQHDLGALLEVCYLGTATFKKELCRSWMLFFQLNKVFVLRHVFKCSCLWWYPTLYWRDLKKGKKKETCSYWVLSVCWDLILELGNLHT